MVSLLEYTISQKREIMTCNLEKKELIETGLQMTHTLELADKDFKTGIINVLKKMN